MKIPFKIWSHHYNGPLNYYCIILWNWKCKVTYRQSYVGQFWSSDLGDFKTTNSSYAYLMCCSVFEESVCLGFPQVFFFSSSIFYCSVFVCSFASSSTGGVLVRKWLLGFPRVFSFPSAGFVITLSLFARLLQVVLSKLFHSLCLYFGEILTYFLTGLVKNNNQSHFRFLLELFVQFLSKIIHLSNPNEQSTSTG